MLAQRCAVRWRWSFEFVCRASFSLLGGIRLTAGFVHLGPQSDRRQPGTTSAVFRLAHLGDLLARHPLAVLAWLPRRQSDCTLLLVSRVKLFETDPLFASFQIGLRGRSLVHKAIFYLPSSTTACCSLLPSARRALRLSSSSLKMRPPHPSFLFTFKRTAAD